MFHTTRPTAFSAQLAQLHEASPQLQILVERHSACRDDWQPGELLRFSGAEGFEALGALRQRAAALDREVRIAVALNLLTEEGLPQCCSLNDMWRKVLLPIEDFISLAGQMLLGSALDQSRVAAAGGAAIAGAGNFLEHAVPPSFKPRRGEWRR